MKVNVMLESFGTRCRVSLCPGQSEIAATWFANLLWILGGVGSEESFIVAKEKVASAIKSFRAANITQSRRGKGLWRQSPFLFSYVSQRNDTRDVAGAGHYEQGNADCQCATDSEFAGYRSQMEPVEDES